MLADALGLTAIHVNRVLRQLRELDLLTLQKGSVKIHDLAGSGSSRASRAVTSTDVIDLSIHRPRPPRVLPPTQGSGGVELNSSKLTMPQEG